MHRYYHAGVETAPGIVWSQRTRRTYAAAAIEARRMARAEEGGRAVVESWARAHGLRPASADAVSAAEYVD